MRKLFSLFLALVATTALWAHDFLAGGIYYNILADKTNEVAVTYRGPYGSEYNEYSGSLTIPSTVTYNGTTYSVTSIGISAFYDCSSLTSITIPNSVTSIGSSAFYGCSSLTSITIPESVTSIGWEAFYNCSALTSITIPNSVTSIGVGAFEYCTSLTSMVVASGNITYDSRDNCNAIIETATNTLIAGCSNTTIPNSVTSIGEEAFYGCSSLTSITIPNSVTSIGYNAFYGCSSLPVENNLRYADTYLIGAVDKTLSTYSIKEGTKWIGDDAFYYCSSLTSVTIPNSVTSIGYSAFEGCSSLTTITIPNSVTSIEAWAFYGCSSLTSPVYNAHLFAYMPTSYSGAYTIPEGIEQIACYAFNCPSLTSVTIPNSVTSIEHGAFQECSSLTSVTIPNSVTSIGDDAFAYCKSLTSVTIGNSVEDIGYLAFYGCSSLTSVAIPNSVTSIGNSAFSGCSSLTSVTIGNSVEDIGEGAFYKCSSLISINIPNSVTSIGEGAFYKCSSLTSVTIGNSVTSIGDEAFYYCSSLSSVAIGNGVTHINKSIFDGCTGLNLLRLGTGIQSIAADAFSDCTKLYDIYCLAAEPPTGYTSSFANYNAFLHVPCESQRLYMLDVLFGEFKYIECIASDEVTTDDIVITPGLTDVTIIWPSEDYADTYTIIIKKGDEVFCTLTFNAEGQLLNITFAPGRNGNHPAQYAEAVANGKGFRFTVIGLEEATDYTYDITVKDASNKTINSHSGKFTTESLTAVDNITTNNTNIQKILRNGQLIIVRDGVEYNAMGQKIGN